MALVHKHSTDVTKFPKIDKPFASVSSKEIIISKDGKTPLYCEFSGCIGVVMCGNGKWGAVSHLHQSIQNKGLRLDLALSLVAEFVHKKVGEDIVDVLLYYGDPGENLGEKQGMNLAVGTVKTAMGCKNVIDLRRPKGGKDMPWGNEFVYDPGQKIVYTTPAPPGPVLHILNQDKEIEHGTLKFEKPFPFQDKKHEPLVKGMADKGYCILP
jgi:hypothetical protein